MMTNEPIETDSTHSSMQSSEKTSSSPPASVYSASGARPVHSAFGFPHRDRRSPNESTTNPPFIEDDGGSRSNPGLPFVREPIVPVQERPSWSTKSTLLPFRLFLGTPMKECMKNMTNKL